MDAVQITEAGNKLKTSKLPELCGSSKLFTSDTSVAEQENLTSVLHSYGELLHEERVCHKRTLSVARWDSDTNLAVVEQRKGSNVVKFGFHNGDGMFLYPEDALFLMDQGLLELFYQGLPLSMHEAYMLMVPLLPSFEYYEVFSYLCRLGYVVRRHTKEKLIETDERGESKWERGLGSRVKDNNTEDAPCCMEETAEPMASGYVKNLWSEHPEVKPCIRPGEALSTASVLSKLQVMEMLSMNDIPYPEDSTTPNTHCIDFDVFLSVKARKESEKPRFRVVVCRYNDPPPALSTMAKLSQETDVISLKLAVVNDGTLVFYGMFGVDVPSIITVG